MSIGRAMIMGKRDSWSTESVEHIDDLRPFHIVQSYQKESEATD